MEEPKVSREFLVGMLKAALRPSRIDLVEVRRLLRVALLQGLNPVELYQEALQGRPEVYDSPPQLVELLPRELAREKQLDLQSGEKLGPRR